MKKIWLALLLVFPLFFSNLRVYAYSTATDNKLFLTEAQKALEQYENLQTGSRFVYHGINTYINSQDNSADVYEYFAIHMADGEHGIYKAIPESAYFSDLKRFHVQKVEVEEVKYFSIFNPDRQLSKFAIETKETGKVLEPVLFIRVGDPAKELEGPYVFVLHYKIYNVADQIGGKDILGYIWESRFNETVYSYVHFKEVVRNGYSKYQPVASMGALKTLEKSLAVAKKDGYTIVDFRTRGEDIKGLDLGVRFEYPKGFFGKSKYSKELSSEANRLLWRVRLYGFLKFVANIIIYLSVIGPLIGGYIYWRRYGKERFTKTVAPVFVPSDNLARFSFAAKNILAHYEKSLFPAKGLSADIIALAISKLIKLQKEKSGKFSIAFQKKDFDPSTYPKAISYLFNHLLKKSKGKTKISVSDLNITPKVLSEYTKRADKELKAEGVYDRASLKIKSKLEFAVMVMGFSGFFLLFLAEAPNALLKAIFKVSLGVGTFSVMALSLLVGAGILYLWVSKMTRLTPDGIKLYKELMGLKKYISKAEVKRIKFFNDPDKLIKHFETLLPYAIIFGLEHKWFKVFKEALKQLDVTYRPYWYTGSTFSTDTISAVDDVVSSIQKFNTAVTRELARISSSGGSFTFSGGGVSSGGGGFSGGGSSGTW